MQMGNNYDWTRHNSTNQPITGVRNFVVGRLINGDALYWSRNEQGGNRWIADINDASFFDLPTATAFAKSLGGFDVVDKTNGEVVAVNPPKPVAASSDEPAIWTVQFQDLFSTKRLRNPARGVCLHIATQKQNSSGWFIGFDENHRVILVSPVTYARTFSTREAAEHFARTEFSNKNFALDLGKVELHTTLPTGEDLP